MATYKSSYKGSQIDNAVSIANANLNKGSNDTPIYYDSDGLGQAVQKDSTATVSSTKPLTSGGAYDGLEAVVDNSDIQTSTSLGTSGMPPSQNAVKQYVDNRLPAKQDTLYGGYGIDVNGATVSVSDDVFREDEEARLHADLKVDHFGDMSLGTDSEVLELMNEAKHSSFDKSKFTVVGSPNITDDGIASGFSTSNYLRINNNNFIVTQSGTEYRIKTNFKLSDLSVGSPLLEMYSTTANDRIFYYNITTSGKCSTALYNDGWSQGNTTFVTNTEYEWELRTDFLTYYKIYINGNLDINKTITAGSNTTVNYLIIGRSSAGAFLGSIDLKQFSITVDGVEVFSGNKTGIDVLKPDDYTVVGTPAISSDGVVTNFSYNTYVTKSSLNIPIASKIEIFGKFTYKTGVNNIAQALVRFPESAKGLQAYNGKFNWGGSGYLGVTAFVDGNSYDYKIVIEDSSAKVYLWNNGAWVLDLTETTYIPASNFDTIDIGGNRQYLTEETSRRWFGSIDLNAFKIYVDDNLVYQPCLKIPYTQTKDGKKIVDSIYRDRVEDEYTQAGFTPYYTLSDTDYTMATVEEDDIVASLDGATSYAQRADLSIEQQGTTTSGTTVTFPKAFMDTNYALSIPYSAKTATGFTAAADGDYIAEGNVAI